MTIEGVNERELLSSAEQGSQIAYRELVHLHQSAVYRFAWALVGEENAQRVTENAFLTAWRQLEEFKFFNLSFRERLYQLVCLDGAQLTKRSRRTRLNLPSRDEEALNFPFPAMRYDPRTNMEHLALQTDIEESLRALPFSYRQVFLLHEMGDLGDSQISNIVGETAEDVHETLILARAAVRRQIFTSNGFFPVSDEAPHEKKAAPRYQACSEYLPDLAAAADDLCTAQEKQALYAHFANCPGCRGYYESLRAIHHGIAVMKHEPSTDISSYVMKRIQMESEESGDTVPDHSLLRPHRFRPAFGRFTIIALCIALLLLAYSNRLLGSGEESPQDETTPPSQSETTDKTEKPSAPPAPSGNLVPAQKEEADAPEEEPETPTALDEDAAASCVPENNGTLPEDLKLIPDGEVYAGLYLTDHTAELPLRQYCSVSFHSTLDDGRELIYYVVPTENAEELNTALEEAGIVPQSREEAGSIHPESANLLYIVY